MKVDTLTYVQLLGKLERGELADDLNVALSDLIGTLRDRFERRGNKASGKMRLTLSLAYDGLMLDVVPTIELVKPKAIRNRAVLYVTKGDELSFQNPSQMDLPLSAAPAPAAPVVVPEAPAPVVVPEARAPIAVMQ